MTACGKKSCWFGDPAAFSVVLTVQSVEEGKKMGGGESSSTKEAVCNSSWPTHTTSGRSQWWCSNLTDWAQRFVCLKPLTYFYSHCRSQSLYGMIAELMQLVYSNNSMKKKKKKKPNWPKERRLIKCLLNYTHSWQYTKHLRHTYLQKTESIRVMCHRIPRGKKKTLEQWL